MRTTFYWTVIFFLVGLRPISAQTPMKADTLSRSIVAARVDKPPALDGTLTDAAWQDAAFINSFHQREPFERQPATEKTEVRVLYDSRFVYFGLYCFDSEPKKIVATEL